MDLCTMQTRIGECGRSLLEQPTVVAVNTEEQILLAVGKEALSMMARVSGSIQVVRPPQHGVVAFYEYTQKYLELQVKKVAGSLRIFRPNVMITHPYNVTSVERRAVHEAILEVVGSGNALMGPQP